MNRFLLTIFLFFASVLLTQAQIFMDGDDSDWEAEPVFFEAPDNLDGVYPAEVGAAVSDKVDINEATIEVVDKVMYGLLRFWGGPAWPNDAYQNDHEGVIYPESRGYYHFLLDLDNNAETGWKTSWYEAHYTPLGYLESLGQPDQNPIGAEVMQEWGARTNDEWKQENDSAAYVRNLDHWAADYSEYNGETDLGSDYEIFNISIPEPDSAKVMMWEGAAKINSSDDETLVSDYYSYWVGHAWGNDFLEFGWEMTPVQKYFENKDGSSVLKPGDVIGVCGMTETPVDDWGVDMTTRGEYTLPVERTERPEKFVFDGDDSDWSDMPALIEAPDNLDGVYPAEVGAAVSDRVDIKEVKAMIDAENIYWYLKMWGGPCWPNDAYQNDHDGEIYPESRGYYHVLLDIDNNVETGWKSSWYEAHYTPLGYLESLGQPNQSPIGAEVMLEWGGRTNDEWKQENEDAPPFRGLDYWAADYSEYNGETDLGSDYEIYNYSAVQDSTNMMRHDGLLLNNSSDDETTIDGIPDWMAHAWGNDFIEVGMSLRTLKMYYKTKTGNDYFNPGDNIGICGMNETPVDDWGVDMTTRGEIGVMATSIKGNDIQSVPNKLQLSNNYPNPFNPSTTINFSAPNMSNVSLVIYNTLGQNVKTLINNQVLSGKQTFVWDGKNDFGSSVPSGIYFYRLTDGSSSITKRMVLLK